MITTSSSGRDHKVEGLNARLVDFKDVVYDKV